MYALLPASVLVAPRLVIPALDLVLLIAVLLANPRRMLRQTRWSRSVGVDDCQASATGTEHALPCLFEGRVRCRDASVQRAEVDGRVMVAGG